LENDLEYLGSSAIEDKLHENVAATIEHIINANMRVWVLTGDKQETAIDIAKACRLIQEGMKPTILSSTSADDFKASLGVESQIISILRLPCQVGHLLPRKSQK
jgi:phospholipid-transporting ATPase